MKLFSQSVKPHSPSTYQNFTTPCNFPSLLPDGEGAVRVVQSRRRYDTPVINDEMYSLGDIPNCF